MRKNPFLNDERGDTNFVSIIFLLILVIVFCILFFPYIEKLACDIKNLLLSLF